MDPLNYANYNYGGRGRNGFKIQPTENSCNKSNDRETQGAEKLAKSKWNER